MSRAITTAMTGRPPLGVDGGMHLVTVSRIVICEDVGPTLPRPETDYEVQIRHLEEGSKWFPNSVHPARDRPQ